MIDVPSLVIRNVQRKLRVPLPPLRAFAERAVRICVIEPSRGESVLASLREVNVLLVSDRRIAALHKKFMNIPGPTDVITFQHGEIFVSVETARRNARAFHTSTDEEIKLYIIHGLLHLHGFEDKTAAATRVMQAAQSRILSAASF